MLRASGLFHNVKVMQKDCQCPLENNDGNSQGEVIPQSIAIVAMPTYI